MRLGTLLPFLLLGLFLQAQVRNNTYSIELESGYALSIANQVIKGAEFDLGSMTTAEYSKIGNGIPLNLTIGYTFNKFFYTGIQLGAFYGNNYSYSVLVQDFNSNTSEEKHYSYQLQQYTISPLLGVDIKLKQDWGIRMCIGPMVGFGELNQELDIVKVNDNIREGAFYTYKGGLSYGAYSGIQISRELNSNCDLFMSVNMNFATYKPDYKELTKLYDNFQEVDVSNAQGITTKIEFYDDPREAEITKAGVIPQTQELYQWNSIQIKAGIKYYL